MRSLPAAPTVLVGLVLLATTACGADDAKQETATPPATTSTPAGTPSASDSATDARPDFTATDYRYVLVRTCRCAFLVPVTVTVRDGEVASAVARESGGRGVGKGDPAPESHRLTIDDVIDLAEDPSRHAEVTWPAGQAWPDRVRTDPVAGARDDEVTYVIEQVRAR